MDVAALSTSLSLASTTGAIDTSVLATLQNLDRTVASELFSSIGLGQNVNAFA